MNMYSYKYMHNVCVYVYINIYMCMYVYAYIYLHPKAYINPKYMCSYSNHNCLILKPKQANNFKNQCHKTILFLIE